MYNSIKTLSSIPMGAISLKVENIPLEKNNNYETFSRSPNKTIKYPLH